MADCDPQAKLHSNFMGIQAVGEYHGLVNYLSKLDKRFSYTYTIS